MWITSCAGPISEFRIEMLQVLVNRLYNVALRSSHPWGQLLLSEFVLFQITLSRSRMLVLAFVGAIERAENVKNRPSVGKIHLRVIALCISKATLRYREHHDELFFARKWTRCGYEKN